MTSKLDLKRWLPALIWTGAIIAASSGWFSSGATGGLLSQLLQALGLPLSTETVEELHHVLRKLGHFSAYALLGLLWDRALRPAADGPAWRLMLPFGVCALLASWDEWNQSLLAERIGSAADVALDLLGSSLALIGRHLQKRLQRAPSTMLRVPAEE